jgi:hypothetical protein
MEIFVHSLWCAVITNSQEFGINIHGSFTPGLNDLSFTIMLIANLVSNMTVTIVDHEMAFLHGDLDKEIYLRASMGLSIDKNKTFILQKNIDDLVQTVRKFYEKIIYLTSYANLLTH